MGTRKANGESWISEKPNAQGLWEARVWMGTKGDGRPDRRNVRRKSLADLKKRVKQLESARDAGKVPKKGRPPTVREMLERQMDTVLPSRQRSPVTIQSYRSLCETHIYPRWGAQRADRLLPEDIEDGLAAMLRDGLSAASVRKVFAVLSSTYRLQVKRQNLVMNPCEHVEAPGAPDSEMPSLTDAEARAVLEAAAERPNAARWAIGLGHGLRQGESLGLRWEYVNLDTGLMRIWFQMQRITWAHGCADLVPGQYDGLNDKQRRLARLLIEHDCASRHCKVKPCPKRCTRHTRACPPPCPPDCDDHARLCPHRRDGGMVLRPIKEKRHKDIWLAPEFTELLRKHRDEQSLQRYDAEGEWEDNDLIFCQWNGRPIDPRRDWAEWGAILSAAGLPPRRVHAMRHSTASIALDLGVAMAVVQKMLGHSDIRVTQRYTHVQKTQSQNASGLMARALGLVPGDGK
jgi:site-specific recombinase XerD